MLIQGCFVGGDSISTLAAPLTLLLWGWTRSANMLGAKRRRCV